MILIPRLFVCLAVIVACAGAAEITGTVQDSTGAAVPGIRVSLGARQALTDEVGAFRFADLVPGVYTVKVEQAPFRPASASVQVVANQPVAPVKFTLELAEVRNEVTVTAEAPGITTNPDENVSSITLEGDELQSLPVLGTDYTSVLDELVGGAGADPGGSTVIVDGVEMEAGSVPLEAIQQVRINRDPYTAEFARPGRGRIEITTRSATSDFHGSLRMGFRDSALDARNSFAADRPDENRRLFAGFLSGPLDRSGKTSFMLAAEKENDRLQSVVYAQTPEGLLNQQIRTPQDESDMMVKIRRLVGDKHVFSLRYDRERRSAQNQGVGGFRLPEVGFAETRSEDEWRLQHTAFVSANLISDLSLEWESSTNRSSSISGDARQLVVADAFVAGGAQVNQRRTEKEFGLKYVLSWSKGRHMIRGGVSVPDWNWQTFQDLGNRQGTYQFASLSDYLAGQPFAFTQQLGNGLVRFQQRSVGLFVQDTVNLKPGLTLGVGLRYDRQNYLGDPDNFAPRLSLAYAPGRQGNTVIRAGFGVFYDRMRSDMLQDLLLFGAGDFTRLIISNPSWPDPFATGSGQTVAPPTTVRAAANLRTPYLLHNTVAVEHKLAPRLTASATYTHYRAIGRFRSRDLNAPFGPAFVRPDPAFSVIRQIESSGTMTSHSLELGLSGRMTKFFTGAIRYELGRVMSNADNADTLPANSYNIGSEWSRSNRDRRHVLRAMGNLSFWSLFQTGFRLSAGTGAPYNLTTGRDENEDGFANDRPQGVFRNSLQGPGWVRLDVRFTKELALSSHSDGPRLALTADAFNILNRVNYQSYIGNLSSPFFGLPVAAHPARRMQLGLRFSF